MLTLVDNVRPVFPALVADLEMSGVRVRDVLERAISVHGQTNKNGLDYARVRQHNYRCIGVSDANQIMLHMVSDANRHCILCIVYCKAQS